MLQMSYKDYFLFEVEKPGEIENNEDDEEVDQEVNEDKTITVSLVMLHLLSMHHCHHHTSFCDLFRKNLLKSINGHQDMVVAFELPA